MGVNRNLHAFLRSLNRGEIRQIRPHLSKKRRKVFDLLLKMDEYDHKALVKAIKPAPENHVASLKNALFDKCLTILNKTRRISNKPSVMDERANRIEELIQRGFLDEAQKRLDRLFASAIRMELFELTMRLIDLERWSFTISQPKDMAFRLDNLQDLEIEMLYKLRDWCEKKAFYSRVGRIKTLHTTNKKDEAERQLLESEKLHPPLSFRSKLLLLLATARLNLEQQEFDHCSTIFDTIIALIDSNPHFKGDPHIRNVYQTFVFESAASAIWKSDLKKLEDRIQLLRNQADQYPTSSHLEIEGKILYLQMQLAKSFLKVDVCREAIDGLRQLIKRGWEMTSLNRRISLLFLGIELCIYQHQFKTAKEFLRRLSDLDDRKKRILIGYSKILRCIIHFELGEYELLDSAINHAKYFYKSRKCRTKFEEIVLRRFSRLAIDTRSAMQTDQLEKLKVDLQKLFEDDSYWKQKEIFDLISWIESRLMQKSLLEVLREKKSES